ncbi:hypothetical protein E4U12_007748 [Claviceps purpurea]|nr:hypothetical protein E4U12_007748 [Claviceps purpurea]
MANQEAVSQWAQLLIEKVSALELKERTLAAATSVRQLPKPANVKLPRTETSAFGGTKRKTPGWERVSCALRS